MRSEFNISKPYKKIKKMNIGKNLITLLIGVSFFTVMGVQKRYNIGLMVMATGKYVQFVEPLITSADKYFCTNHNVYYFIFTDGQPPAYPRLVRIEQKRLGWPHDTMMRFSVYYNSRELLSKMDYLFATDADMLFVDEVGDEILSPRVGTLHPGWFGTCGTPERNRQSTACITIDESNRYFCGGFYGGQTAEVLKLLETTSKNIMTDLKKNLIAVWHDESHINRYFVDNPPTKVLSPSYCYVGIYRNRWDQPYPAKLVALDKNHAELRK
jgi:histo-blood group ABO system transferase